MHLKYSALIAVFVTSNAMANHAVQEANYSLMAGSSRFSDDTANVTFTGREMGGDARVPVAGYLGLGLYASSTETDVTATQCDTLTAYDIGAQLFARNGEQGKVGLGYSRSASDSCGSITGKSTTNADNYTLSIDRYLGPYTLGASRSRTAPEGMADRYQSSFALGWYPDTHAYLGVSTTGVDRDQDRITWSMEWQPTHFANGEWYLNYRHDFNYTQRIWNLGVRYTNLAVEVNYSRITSTSETWGIGFRYFYERPTDLLTRHRYYR